MTTIAASELRTRSADLLNRVAYQGDRIRIERHGKVVAVLVPKEDLDRLRAAEDRLDAAAAREALRETQPRPETRRRKAKQRKTGKSRVPVSRPRTSRELIPWTKVKSDLGL
jgi:prevent-host-death family protein